MNHLKIIAKTYVIVAFEQAQKSHLAKDSVSVDLIFEEILDLLDRHKLVFLSWLVPVSFVDN